MFEVRRALTFVMVVVAALLLVTLNASALVPEFIVPVTATFSAVNNTDSYSAGCNGPLAGNRLGEYLPLNGTSTSSQSVGHLDGNVHIYFVNVMDDGGLPDWEDPSGSIRYTVTQGHYVTKLKGNWVGTFVDDHTISGSGVIAGPVVRDGQVTHRTVRTSIAFSFDDDLLTMSGTLGGPLTVGGGYAIARC